MSSEEGGSEDDDDEDEASSSRSIRQPDQDLSMDEFRQIVMDLATWCDGRGLLGMLKILFRDIVDVNQDLQRASNVTELLSHLVGPGLLNEKDLTILYDTVKVTKQSGFTSTIKEKLYHFQNIDKLQVTSFTKHRISILNFGKELSDSNIAFLDGRYNFPGLKKYKDSWSLIADLDTQGILKEENIEGFREVLRQNGMDVAEKCFIDGDEPAKLKQPSKQKKRPKSSQDKPGTSNKKAQSETEGNEMGPSQRQKIKTKDEIIREYLFEQQRKFCIKANAFTPAIMQSRYKVDMAYMFTDLDLIKENQRKIDPKPIKLDELLSVIKSTPACKVLIDGEGGIGKTTLLRYLSYGWAKETDQTFQGKIVFLVNIRDINSGEDILDVMMKHIKLKHFNLNTEAPANLTIKKFILKHENEIVLFLDGLDELKIGVDDPINLIKGEEMENCVVILTSRSENIDEYIKESDVHVKIKGFNPENIKTYITRHFKYFEAPNLGESLIEELELNKVLFRMDKHPEVYSMCKNPMLLLSVCFMWEEKKYLPTEKTVLFEAVFRSILNQYNREKNNDQNIDEFQDTPSELIDAMLVLGRGMYESLKINQLYINRKRLKGNKDTVALALKLGFVYKDSPTSKDDFKDTFSAPHKLLLEALVGFYLHKLSLQTGESRSSGNTNMNEREIMETNLLLDEREWDSIIDNDHLKVAREFAIGFLGSKADAFLNHWVTNSFTTYRSLITHLRIVKEEHRFDVVNALSAHPNMTHLSIKPNIDRVCVSLMKCVHYMIPDVREDYNFLELLRNIHGIGPLFSKLLQACFTESDRLVQIICNENSSEEKGLMLAHIMIAIPNQEELLTRVHETCDDDVIGHLNSECQKLHFKYDITDFTLKQSRATSLFLIHLLSYSPRLTSLALNKYGKSGVVCDMLKEVTTRGCKFALTKLCIYDYNIGNNDCSLFPSFLMLTPKLKVMSITNCNISGRIINNMINKCCGSGHKLLLKSLDISDNPLENLCGSSFASLMVIAPELEGIHMRNCKLSGHVLNDMVQSLPGKITELSFLNLSGNNLSHVDGGSLASLMSIRSIFGQIDVSDCNLSGEIIKDMNTNFFKRGAKFKYLSINLSRNNLSQLDGSSLAYLISIPGLLHMSELNVSDCTLSGDIIKAMTNELSKQGVKIKFRLFNLSGNNLSQLDGSSLANLISTPSHLTELNVSDCTLSGDIIKAMTNDLSKRGVNINVRLLNLSGNNLSQLDGSSLAYLISTSSCLLQLNVSDCTLSGDIIKAMTNDLSKRGVNINVRLLNLSGNNLSQLDGSSLANLISISSLHTRLNVSDCTLSGDIIKAMTNDLLIRGVKIKLSSLDLSGNNLSQLDGSSLANLISISSFLSVLNISDCTLSGDIIKAMTNDLSKQGVKVKLSSLDLSWNNLSQLDGSSLASLKSIFSSDTKLILSNCTLPD